MLNFVVWNSDNINTCIYNYWTIYFKVLWELHLKTSSTVNNNIMVAMQVFIGALASVLKE